MVAECLDILTRNPARTEDRHPVFLGHLRVSAPLVAMEMDFLECGYYALRRLTCQGKSTLASGAAKRVG
jgi:hypothetical protein